MLIKNLLRLCTILFALLVSQNVLARNHATFVSQYVPNRLESGMSYQASVTFKNDGDTAWTAGAGYSLVSKTGNTWYNNGWVRLAAGESVAVGATKTFNFTITAPTNLSGQRMFAQFSWKMLQEGVEWFGDQSPVVGEEIYFAPAITTNYPPSGPPPSAASTNFSFSTFRGANVLGGSGGLLPNRTEMEKIANAAINMKLNYIRIHVVIPDDSDTSTTTNDATQAVLDTAYSYGLKTIVAINGYNGYLSTCDWRRPFTSIKNNAARFVQRFASHPGLLAWDLNNEPMWFASASNCLTAGTSAYQDVVDGVHAMYNLVRANDQQYNRPTTVGDYPAPFMKYWNDISSFASPHFYVEMNNAAPDWALLRTMAASNIDQYKTVTQGLPLVIGEFGFDVATNGHVTNETDRATAYQNFYSITNAQNKNMGTMFWELSTAIDQQPWSIINTDASWKAAAAVVATQVSETRNAAYVTESVQSGMTHGQLYNVSITMKNTGSATWSLAQYKLGVLATADNWGVTRATLSSSPIEAIFSGQSKTFQFSVRAPATPGIYHFQWRMLREGVEWFGATTPDLLITVN